MTHLRYADDFVAIRARLAELRRQSVLPTGDGDARSVTGPSPNSDSAGPVLRQKPGIPGWRVARRKRQSSQT